MDKRLLGNSDMNISRLGLGSWAIGGDIGDWGWGKQSEKDSIKTIHAALESGINWIDTAPAYGLGNAENVIGKALKQTHYKPFIFTKCGFTWAAGESELNLRLDKASITAEIDASLSRLNVDIIDLYQIHRPLSNDENEEAWRTLAELKQQGKVRHIGVSNFSDTQLEHVHAIAEITSNQPPYSLINRGIEKKVQPWCQQHNVGIINHSTMGWGLLSGAMNKARFAQLDRRDWRHKCNAYKDPAFSQHLELVDFLKAMAEEKGCSVAHLSIAWTLGNPATTGSIVGARNITQLEGLFGATDVNLSTKEYTAINSFIDVQQAVPV
ncbi:aldo/keto reductase [Photobacterium frigidiphilum]|uniref:Aldo/keto reductase n=1 Tax=Photobacterium frigidiphilum TaxID=264736 RepID=A0A2T3JMK9_9GAMM|nr:aldo/keto reductase [Photobacterium frigidiphilum]PSU50271.1 aldo/keto reductase [Photobacterium frigidiphilum]